MGNIDDVNLSKWNREIKRRINKMDNVEVLEMLKEAQDSVLTTPSSKIRMKKRYKLRLSKLSAIENLFQIDKEKSMLKLRYREFSLDGDKFTLFPIIEKWLISQIPKDRKDLMYWKGDLRSIVKVVGITPKRFLLSHIDLCKQYLTDLREVKKRFKREFKDSRKISEEILPTKTEVVSENRSGETNNSELY
jgi:hypothetical protein